MDLIKAANALQTFGGENLTQTLADVERAIRGTTPITYANAVKTFSVTPELLTAAGLMKQVAGQINVIVHAAGILTILPHILRKDEIVEYVSLGAGNTGREFDLETNYRIAEFKFIRWLGGPESIRQNQLFKDFYLLARSAAKKEKVLYVVGTEFPLKFLKGGRALSSVFSRHSKIVEMFKSDFGNQFRTVREYYAAHKDEVKIEDVSRWIPELIVG